MNPELLGPHSLPLCWANSGNLRHNLPSSKVLLCIAQLPLSRAPQESQRHLAASSQTCARPERPATLAVLTDAYPGARLTARRATAVNGGVSTATGKSSTCCQGVARAHIMFIRTGRQSTALQKALRSPLVPWSVSELLEVSRCNPYTPLFLDLQALSHLPDGSP